MLKYTYINSNNMRTKKNTNHLNIEVALGVVAIIITILGVIILAGGTHSSGDGGNMLFDGLYYTIGGLSYILPFVFFYTAYLLWRAEMPNINIYKIIGTLLVSISSLAILSLSEYNFSGLIGKEVFSYISKILGVIPSVIMLAASAYIGLMIFTGRRHVFNFADGLFSRLAFLSSRRENRSDRDEEVEEEMLNNKKEKTGMFGGMFSFLSSSKKDLKVTNLEDQNDDEEEEETENKNTKTKGLHGDLFKNFKQTETEEEMDEEDEIVDEEEVEIKTEKSVAKKSFRINKFIVPPVDILEEDGTKGSAGDTLSKMKMIKNTLLDFGVQVEMGSVSVGPTVTQYTIKPAAGVKVQRIEALKDDLQMALAASNVHIQAPIPGKPFVGIEVPNEKKQTLGLRSMLEVAEFKNSSPLTIAIGRDIIGKAVYGDLEKMPHLLIAGATRSGKSVTLQNVLISMLYKNSPDELKLIIIDPKRVEFTTYKPLPHLYTPIITDPKNGIRALNWAIGEMERRYTLFAEEFHGIQNLGDYNKKILNPAMELAKKTKNFENMPPQMPYIVIVFDEYNDFMLQYPKEITAAIMSLAQKGRAAGIHLILATQRPDTKVITGNIKANIPARIALKTTSQIDSRTILDQMGAEDLLGNGDMMYMDPYNPNLRRLQAPYVSSEEVSSVIDYIKNSYTDYYDKVDISKTSVNAVGQGGSANGVSTNQDAYSEGAEEPDDDDYLKAKEFVITSNRSSASQLQSRFGWGYPKANKMITLLERFGVVGPLVNNKREILAGTSQIKKGDREEDNSLEDLF